MHILSPEERHSLLSDSPIVFPCTMDEEELLEELTTIAKAEQKHTVEQVIEWGDRKCEPIRRQGRSRTWRRLRLR